MTEPTAPIDSKNLLPSDYLSANDATAPAPEVKQYCDGLGYCVKGLAAPEVTAEPVIVCVGWICKDGTPALRGSKPVEPGALLYARKKDLT